MSAALPRWTRRVWILPALALPALCACLERTTGQPKPLDPRFVANAPGSGGAGEEHAHDPNAGPAGPFDDFKGPMVTLRGTLVGAQALGVDLDLRSPDPSAPGGNKHLGKVQLEGLGPFELQVPRGYGLLTIEAFQDLNDDGPGDDDPFATTELKVGDEDLAGVLLTLEVGGRAKHFSAKSSTGDLFRTHEGDWVLLSGEVRSPSAAPVDLDLRVMDPASQTGDAFLGKLVLPGPGPYELRLPAGFGALAIEAFQDQGGDGPSPDDTYDRVDLVVGAVPLAHDFELMEGGRGPQGAPAGIGPARPNDAGGLSANAAPLFTELGSDPVTVSGRVVQVGRQDPVVDLDVFLQDRAAPGGRRYLGKLKVTQGSFVFQAPRNVGLLELEAFVDLTNNGPTPDDPFGAYAGNPLPVGSRDLSALEIQVAPRAP